MVISTIRGLEDISLRAFDFHGAAKEFAEVLSDSELKAVEEWLDFSITYWTEEDINGWFADEQRMLLEEALHLDAEEFWTYRAGPAYWTANGDN